MRNAGSELVYTTVTMHRVSLGLLAMTWFCLLAAGATLTVEYYDGYEYIMTGMAVVGEGSYFFPKNPVLSSFLSTVYAVLELGHLDTRSLANYHLPILILNLGLSLVLAKWIKLFCPTLSIVTIAALLCFNRSFFHYAPFALPDALIACSIGLWLYTDASVPMQSWPGKLARMVILACCVLQRPQTVMIPAACILAAIIGDRRRVAAAAQIVFGSVAVYVVLNTLFFYRGVNLSYEGGLSGLGTKPNLIEAIIGPFAFLRYYFFDLVLSYPEQHSVWDYLRSIFEVLNPVGMGLFALGALQLRKTYRSKQRPELLGGLLVGSICFMVFLLYVRTIGASRYLTPLLPALTLVQCLGLVWLVEKKKVLGSLVLVGIFCFSVIPEVRHFYHPFYRTDLERRTIREIEEWSQTEPIYFTGSAQSPFFSKENILHDFDPDFYLYRSMPAFVFYGGSSLRYLGQDPTFEDYGFPIPDRLENLIEPNQTLIVPPVRIYQEAIVPWEIGTVPLGTRVTPLYAVRWSSDPTPGKSCSPLVPDLCVEVHTPSPAAMF